MLKAEVFAARRFAGFAELQRSFDAWRSIYNLQRPHEALGMAVPASRYRLRAQDLCRTGFPRSSMTAARSSAASPPPGPYVSFKGRLWKVPGTFQGERLAIRPRGTDGHHAYFFGSRPIAKIDLTCCQSVSDVSKQVSVMSPV